MTTLTISILMPCYNAEKTLEQALESLVQQTLGEYEIIAVNDGSTDQTGKILASWSARESRLNIINQTHQGIIHTLNSGLAVCKGDYIARMDCDDRCHPQRLELQANYLDHHPEIGVVSCRVAAFPADGVRQGFQIYLEWLNSLLTDADIRREMFVESPLPHPSVMFRRAVVEAAGGYQELGWPEDYDLWLRLYLQGVGFARLPQVLFEWREHPDRLTRIDPRYSVENFLRAKSCYLLQGPLKNRDAIFIWGAGMMGRRISKHLGRNKAPLVAFIDIDPRKIGNTRRGLPIKAPDELLKLWSSFTYPVLLVAVGARGARPVIRQRLAGFGLREAQDWWFVA